MCLIDFHRNRRMNKLKVVSWNMNKRKSGTWDHLKRVLDPDMSLLQETSPLDQSIKKSNLFEVDVKKNLRNSIFSEKHIMERVKFPKEFNTDMICVKSSINETDYFFISIYGNLSFLPFFTIFIGQISLIVNFLRTTYDAKHIIIAGDFNCDRRMDDNPTGSRFARKGERVTNLFFDSILGLGFKDCLRKFHSNYIETYRHHIVKSRYPWEIDHMFCTDHLYAALKSINVLDDEVVKELSDHNPIVAEFDL